MNPHQLHHRLDTVIWPLCGRSSQEHSCIQVQVPRRAYPCRSGMVSFDTGQAGASPHESGSTSSSQIYYPTLAAHPLPSLPSTPQLEMPALPSLPSTPNLTWPSWEIPTIASPPHLKIPFSWRWGATETGMKDVSSLTLSQKCATPASIHEPSPELPEDEASVEAAPAEAFGEVAAPPSELSSNELVATPGMSRGGDTAEGKTGGEKIGDEAGVVENASVQSPVKVLIARWDQASS